MSKTAHLREALKSARADMVDASCESSRARSAIAYLLDVSDALCVLFDELDERAKKTNQLVRDLECEIPTRGVR